MVVFLGNANIFFLALWDFLVMLASMLSLPLITRREAAIQCLKHAALATLNGFIASSAPEGQVSGEKEQYYTYFPAPFLVLVIGSPFPIL